MSPTFRYSFRLSSASRLLLLSLLGCASPTREPARLRSQQAFVQNLQAIRNPKTPEAHLARINEMSRESRAFSEEDTLRHIAIGNLYNLRLSREGKLGHGLDTVESQKEMAEAITQALESLHFSESEIQELLKP